MRLRMREIVLVVMLFLGYIFFGNLSGTGRLPYIICTLSWHIFFTGMILLFFQTQFEKRIWLAVLLILTEMLVWNFLESFVSIFVLVFRHVVKQESNPLPDIWEGNEKFFVKAVTTAVSSLFLLKWFDAVFEKKCREWYILQTVPFVVMIVIIDLYNQGASSGVLFWGGENYSLYYNQLFSHGAVCLLTLIFLCASGGCFFGMEKLEWEQRKREQYEWEVKGYRALENQYDQMEKLRHDIKNHVISLSGLLKNREYEKMAHYLEQMAVFGAFGADETVTGNKALDALLCQKQRECKEKEIRWDCHMQIPKSCPLEEIDLCIIMGNALDNAIEECSRLNQPSEKFVEIQAGMSGHFFLLKIKNGTHLQKIQETYVSKKRKTGMRGIGLSNIRDTVLKYNGVADLETENGIFSISILIPPSVPDGRS
ncbi:MAG: GHKL domain-containing protein [Roseburia sp.]|nr:GHKL domain-containing protein [Roseburia sp.]